MKEKSGQIPQQLTTQCWKRAEGCYKGKERPLEKRTDLVKTGALKDACRVIAASSALLWSPTSGEPFPEVVKPEELLQPRPHLLQFGH